MKTGEIYIYNSLKNLQIYNFLYQISTFYKIISPKILHLQTPLLSTILQYFFSVFLHSTLIFLAKSTIYKITNPPPHLEVTPGYCTKANMMVIIHITNTVIEIGNLYYYSDSCCCYLYKHRWPFWQLCRKLETVQLI